MVCGLNGAFGVTVANLVAMGLIVELENVNHPNLEVLTVKELTQKLVYAILITVLVSRKCASTHS